MLDRYELTVVCFSDLLQIAQLTKSKITLSCKGHSKFLLHSISNFLKQFRAELCFAHVFLLMLAFNNAMLSTESALGNSVSAMRDVLVEYLLFTEQFGVCSTGPKKCHCYFLSILT